MKWKEKKFSTEARMTRERILGGKHFNITISSLIVEVRRNDQICHPIKKRLAVDRASDGLSGAENLLDGAFQLARHGALAHDAGDVNDLVEGDVAAVLNVLDLLAVTRRLLEGADEESGSAGNYAHRRLTILDRQLHRDAETFPVLSGLGDIVTNLLR